MRRRAITVGVAGFAASATLLVLALADVERTTLSFLAAIAWLAGSGGILAALLQGQRMSLRGQDEILKLLGNLSLARDLESEVEAMQPAIRQVVIEANETMMWAIDARLVGIAEQALNQRTEVPEDESR